MLRLLVGTKFQDLFHSPPGVLFTFPSLYLFTIDRISYLALAGGPAGFKQGFSCPVLLEKKHIRSARFRVRDFHVLWLVIQTILLTTLISYLTNK